MKILIIIATFVSVVTSSYAQRNSIFLIKGKVSDATSGEALPYAHAFVTGEGDQFLGTITDINGTFELKVPNHQNYDTLHVSFVGYKKASLPLLNLTEMLVEVPLVSQATILPEVVVRGISARVLFTKCLQQAPMNYASVSFLNKGSYWNYVQQDSSIIEMQESSIIARENNFGRKTTLAIFFSKSNDHPKAYSPLDSLKNVFYFDQMKSSSGIMNIENVDEWNFEYGKELTDGNYIWVIAKRKDRLGNAKILINDQSYSIEDVQFHYAWNSARQHVLNDTLNYGLKEINGRFLYRKNNKKYNLKYLFVDVKYNVFNRLSRSKEFSREIVHEVVIESSKETYEYVQPASPNREEFLESIAVVNIPAYCRAIKACRKNSFLCDQ